jgi:sugar diacid utilization regulator
VWEFVHSNGAKAAYMEKKDLVPGGDAIHFLKLAALQPQRRGAMITRALQELLVSLPAVGAALVWPCQEGNVPWKLYYAGTHRESMRRWLTARLNSSLDATLAVLQQDLSSLTDMPFAHLMCLQPASMFPAGLWIVWPTISPLPREALDVLKEVRRTLEALIEVESLEGHYFSSTSPLSDRALVEALGQGDPQALSALLSMMRLVANAEFSFWGRAYRDVVECSDHMGAKQSGFGFALPRGRGAGGYVAARGIPILVVEDYRNSVYRHPSVSDIIDGEQIRSALVLPIRSRKGQEISKYVTGVLYVARRAVEPFSLAEQLLVQRVTHLLEPLPPPARPASFLMPGLPPVSDQKVAWHKLILHANRIESLEAWISQFIQGTIVVTDSDGQPYVSARSEQLEHLQAAFDNSMEGVQVISLDAPGVALPGQVYLRSAMALPPASWPEFFTDLVMACNLIIGRMEEARDYLARQREQWLHAVLQEKLLPQLRQNGYQLGLPVGEGQLWVIAWPSQGQGQAIAPTTRQAIRKRMRVENIVLDQLESPLLFLGDDVGVVLLGVDAEPEPSKLHDALLNLFVPHPLWIVYGARYHSLQDLKIVLTHSISLAQKARRKGNSEYLLNVQTPGLESLLVNPRLTEDLRLFATKLLAPLLEYDRGKGTDLTTTFVLAQTLGSTQTVSDELGVHVNTIRYRLHKAEDILGIEEASPQERVTWGLASFIWMNVHPSEQTTSYSGSQKG